jgi:hypothetical protein
MIRRLIIGATLGACTPAPVPPPSPLTPAAEVIEQQRKWNAANVRNYAFTYRDRCFCFGSFVWVRITVSDGKVSHAELTDTTSYGFHHTSEFRRPTVDSLFIWVVNAYKRNSERVDIRYDRTFHFPTEAMMDWKLNMADDEFAFEVRDFMPGPSKR